MLCSVDSVEEEVAAELKQLMDEVWVLGSLSHPSITRFCALCLDPPTIVMQVRCSVPDAEVCVWASCNISQIQQVPEPAKRQAGSSVLAGCYTSLMCELVQMGRTSLLLCRACAIQFHAAFDHTSTGLVPCRTPHWVFSWVSA